MAASVVKGPTMIMVTDLCGRVLSERAMRLFFTSSFEVKSPKQTHTGNCGVTVQVPLACYFRPGHMASCAHSDESVHPLGGSQAKLRFLALPGSSIWPRFPLGTELRKDRLSRGGQFARWVLRLNNGTAFLEHTKAGSNKKSVQKL